MPSDPNQTNLANWFKYLTDLQNGCAKINTDANPAKMTLLAFANSKIKALLPSANERAQFIINAKAAPGIDIAPDDLSTRFSTFKELLQNFSDLATLLAVCLREKSAGTFPGGALKDFLSAKVNAAFPGGSSGTNWSAAKQVLIAAMGAVCFSPALQAATDKVLDDSNNTVSTVRDRIAVLG
jgi:hypothetical protein